MTQQDIVDELNRIVVGYSITWDNIKRDLDRAIIKINSYLGANYPRISEIMLAPKHRYTLRVKGEDIPIFPEKYLLSVVIPFVASEILARDEEFTTIYNKYILDYENGLFEMFQNEFNRVPLIFRQKSDIGVFFSKDVPEHKVHVCSDNQLPTFVFKVYYHLNLDAVPYKKFTMDPNLYEYGTKACILDSTQEVIPKGIYANIFKGWALEPENSIVIYKANDTIEVKKDTHLYAVWETKCILTVKDNTLGFDPTCTEYLKYFTTLVIPEYIKGVSFKIIPANFLDNTEIIYVKLPKAEITLASYAFNGAYNLKELVFPDFDYLRNKPIITIESNAIAGTSIAELSLPYSVRYIASNAISDVKTVITEVTETYPPGWSVDCFSPDVTIEWGKYHG